MKFVKLHQKGNEILVNMRIVSDVHRSHESGKSALYFNGSEQVSLTVDESLDEIYEKVKGGGR